MLWTSKSSAWCDGTFFTLFLMWSALLLSVEPGMYTCATGIGVLGHIVQDGLYNLEHLLRGYHEGIDPHPEGSTYGH